MIYLEINVWVVLKVWLWGPKLQGYIWSKELDHCFFNFLGNVKTGSMSTGQRPLRLRLGAVLSSLCCSLAGSMWHLQFFAQSPTLFCFCFFCCKSTFSHTLFLEHSRCVLHDVPCSGQHLYCLFSQKHCKGFLFRNWWGMDAGRSVEESCLAKGNWHKRFLLCKGVWCKWLLVYFALA